MRRLTTWKSRTSVSGLAALVLLLGLASPAFAAKPAHAGGGGSPTPTGNDISWPQCGASFPSGQAFGIVGVNGGLANDSNPCLGPDSSVSQSELYWAATTSSGTPPKASLYVNTADPGSGVSDWPAKTSTTDPLNTVSGTAQSCIDENDPACAWQYGYNKAAQDAIWLNEEATAINDLTGPTTVSTSPGAYPWWLDVETGNTWQSGSNGLAMNVADLQGMFAGLQAAGVDTTSTTPNPSPIGVYSTSSQWQTITGLTATSPSSSEGSLHNLPVWIPGARSLSGAESNCSQTPFTGATSVTLTQWFGHPFDGDYACP